MSLAVLLAAKAVVLVLLLLNLVPLLVWVERKASALIQDRVGPNRAGILGLRFAGMFHNLADVGKMLTKEDIVPAGVDRLPFVLAPALGLTVALAAAAVIPVADVWSSGGRSVPLQVADLDVGILWVFAVSSLGVYSIVLAGWASRSRFPLLGALRSAAQLVSYEVPLALAAISVALCFGTLRPNEIVEAQGDLVFGALPQWGILLQPVAFVIFVTGALAETNRLPFDLPEGESEIVGYHVEYSSMKFGMFMMAEYIHVAVASALAATLFLGGWQVPWLPTEALRTHAGPVLAGLGAIGALGGAAALAGALRLPRGVTAPRSRDALAIGGLGLAGVVAGLAAAATGLGADLGPGARATVAAAAQALAFGAKTLLLCFGFVWVRWTLPRFRYDQLMRLGWRQLTPLALANLVLTAGALAALGELSR
ncbi:MAG: NADH-quinone oxidoreductase subunit H [Planctomycetales bacterium]|nr:NADH-quinone oxidoreductase subunit H [Planctomycetales bacterium]